MAYQDNSIVPPASLEYDFFGSGLAVINLEDSDNDSVATLEDDGSVALVDDLGLLEFHDQTNHLDLESNYGYAKLDSVDDKGATLRARKTVELVDGTFFKITSILQDIYKYDIILRGHSFRRSFTIDNMVVKKKNEVVLIQHYDLEDPRDISHQSICSAGLEQVVKIRRLNLTTSLYPANTYRDVPEEARMSVESILENARLTCRWKLLTMGSKEGSLATLDENECTSGSVMKSEDLRFSFRGPTALRGSCEKWLDGEKDFDAAERARCHHLDPLDFHPSVSSHQRRYTVGDAFCGAGGISRGAKAADARVDWGFDFDLAAIRSAALNIHQTRFENIAAHEFAMVIENDHKVDILHMSPPCQTFAPCHTRPGPDDQMNEATFFAVEAILKKCKPRVVTLEETFGLLRTENNTHFFRAMVHMFTKLGFSVRWKVFNLLNFGLPQPRKRLFFIASCPGEPLPPFPAPTHGSPSDIVYNPHLKPYTTVHDVISQIPPDFPLHNLYQLPPRSEAPYPANQPLKNTITTTTGASIHPSGKRAFTLREIACLQGFPLEHQFGVTRVRKQIGNAVPPLVAKTFFEEIVRALRTADGAGE